MPMGASVAILVFPGSAAVNRSAVHHFYKLAWSILLLNDWYGISTVLYLGISAQRQTFEVVT